MAKQVYSDAELATFEPIIQEAREIWAARCAEYVHKFGDRGSAVLGAGIAVDYLPPRCGVARDRIVIASREITGAQGSLVWEEYLGEILLFLQANGIDAHYDCGLMD